MEPNSPLYIDTKLKWDKSTQTTSKQHDKNETLPNIIIYGHLIYEYIMIFRNDPIDHFLSSLYLLISICIPYLSVLVILPLTLYSVYKSIYDISIQHNFKLLVYCYYTYCILICLTFHYIIHIILSIIFMIDIYIAYIHPDCICFIKKQMIRLKKKW